jgi:mannose-6-phosphate isomerase-like protein (cupin superfamily)
LGAQKIADYPNDAIYEVHREGDGAPEFHETEADIFFVQSGSGILVVGGTLTGADTVAPHELRNGTISGGIRRKLSAGDVVRIPAKTPHQVLLDGATQITYIVVKAKGY